MTTLTRWNPFRDLDDFFGFRQPLAVPSASKELLKAAEWSPSVDISETDIEFLIKAELPEVKKEDIRIECQDGMLTLTGERKIDKEEKSRKHHRVERFYGTFSRTFSLPETVNAEQIKAEHKNGMLYIHLPKTVRPSAKSVAVKVD